MAMIPYLRTFFNEKDLPDVSWELTAKDGVPHIISNEVVMEHIETSSVNEQRKIAGVILKIDFENGDVNHFLKHLAGAIING